VTCGTSADANPQTDIRPIFWDYLKVFGSTLGTQEDFMRVLNFEPLSNQATDRSGILVEDAGRAQQRLAEENYLGEIILRMDA
jgi:D-arabinose 1-dehydrogenase-like Zn-dependent alcohol dehydrogenase